MNQEKPLLFLRYPYRKPTQVDEERILRPAEEALLRKMCIRDRFSLWLQERRDKKTCGQRVGLSAVRNPSRQRCKCGC